MELLLRVIGAFVALPTADSATVVVLAGVAGLAGGAAVVLAASIVSQMCSFLGVLPRERPAHVTAVPRLSRQNDPDAAGQPRPRAPGRPSRPTATIPPPAPR